MPSYPRYPCGPGVCAVRVPSGGFGAGARPGRLRLGRAQVHARGELVVGVVCVLVLEMPAGVRLHVLGAVVWGSPERCARAPVTPR